MPVYRFEAMNAQGQTIKNEIDAVSEEEAIQKIRAQKLFPTSVKVKADRRGGLVAGQKRRKKSFTIGGVSNKQLTLFTRQLSTLQDAGLPIVRSLKILEGQLKPGVLKNMLITVADDVEGGMTFSEALAKHPKAFDKLYVNMVKAGEIGGVLDAILQRLADFREKSQRLKKQIIGAMIYPAAVITVAGGIVGGILTFIVPKFKKMFEELDVELPPMTQDAHRRLRFREEQLVLGDRHHRRRGPPPQGGHRHPGRQVHRGQDQTPGAAVRHHHQ